MLGSLSCLLDDDARRRTFASARDCVSAGARFVIEVYNPPVVHAMHSAHPDPIDVDTEYPGGSALRSRYRISGDGKLWMAEHRWETDDATTSQFGETVALVDPLDLIALASPWWRPVALLNDWQGEPVGSPPGPMLVLVLEAVGGREAP